MLAGRNSLRPTKFNQIKMWKHEELVDEETIWNRKDAKKIFPVSSQQYFIHYLELVIKLIIFQKNTLDFGAYKQG